jgi:hypothetical protein
VHPVHVEDTRRDDVIDYQRTEHLIDGHKMTISKTTPTAITGKGSRTLEFISEDGQPCHMAFGREGFELLKAIVNQY